MVHRPPRQFSPPRSGPCLCGSGLKYKRCCVDRLPGHEQSTQTRAFLKEGKYKDALYACRADVTQYTIWHKSHTEPAIRRGMPKKGSILEIDIRALADYVDNLMFCYIKTDMMDEFPSVLERLRANINDPDWQRKIVYFHALHALWPDWNRTAGRRELKKLGSVSEDKDEQILQLYLDLFGDDLAFSERLDLVDRILTFSERFTDHLHYKGAKAVLYLTIGDQRKAEAELTEAIAEARSKHEEDGRLNEYERYRLALMLDLLGVLRGDDGFLREALDMLRSLLKDEDLTSKGRANLLGHIGDTYRHTGDWESARQAYVQALDMEPAPIYKVFLSDCLLQLDKFQDAWKTLEEVKVEDLSSAEQADYAFTFAAIAIESGERGRLEQARAALKDVEMAEPHFREERNAFLLNVQEALASGASRSLIKRTRRLIGDMARSVTSYLILRPSFMGVGVDVGKILEDLSKDERRSGDDGVKAQSALGKK
jgi:tetratricopeptide (TPR) repeat protein